MRVPQKKLLSLLLRIIKPKVASRVRHLGPGSIPPRATKKHQNHLRVVFSFWGLVGLGAISLGYRYIEPSFNRTNQIGILVAVDVALNDIHYFYVLPKYCYRIQETKAPTNSF